MQTAEIYTLKRCTFGFNAPGYSLSDWTQPMIGLQPGIVAVVQVKYVSPSEVRGFCGSDTSGVIVSAQVMTEQGKVCWLDVGIITDKCTRQFILPDDMVPVLVSYEKVIP